MRFSRPNRRGAATFCPFVITYPIALLGTFLVRYTLPVIEGPINPTSNPDFNWLLLYNMRPRVAVTTRLSLVGRSKFLWGYKRV